MPFVNLSHIKDLAPGLPKLTPLASLLQACPVYPPHLADVAKVLDVVPLSAEDLIDDICAHLILAALGLWTAVIGLSSPGPRGLVVVRGLILVHPQL